MIEILETIRKTLARNLRALRKAHGFRSAEAFAEAAGMPFPTYRALEHGDSWPEESNVMKIARTLRVEPTALFAAEEKLALYPTKESIPVSVAWEVLEGAFAGHRPDLLDAISKLSDAEVTALLAAIRGAKRFGDFGTGRTDTGTSEDEE